jgi:hypothetical protein
MPNALAGAPCQHLDADQQRLPSSAACGEPAERVVAVHLDIAPASQVNLIADMANRAGDIFDGI